MVEHNLEVAYQNCLYKKPNSGVAYMQMSLRCTLIMNQLITVA